MKQKIGTSFIKTGHIISMIGCNIRGFHIPDRYIPNYCLLCGRRL